MYCIAELFYWIEAITMHESRKGGWTSFMDEFDTDAYITHTEL
jgi:hypothetical protein